LDAWGTFIYLLGGVPVTLSISIISFLVGIVIGLPLAFIRVYEKKASFLVDVYEKIFRGIPEIVLLLLFFFGVGPYLPFPFGNPFIVACFVLGLRSGANQSQIYRGAIRGVGDEQMVAGMSIGFSKWRAIWHIMVPQVFSFSTSGLGSEYALLIKDSAYVYVIGVVDVMYNATRSARTPPYDQVTPYLLSAVLYIILTFPLAYWLDRWGNKRKKKTGL
jgi:polar amino acid transport system permease protein